MGSRAQREAPKNLDNKKKRAAVQRDTDRPFYRRGHEASGVVHSNIIDATQDIENLAYKPRTAETREVFELMLSAVHRTLGDQAQDVVRSAADTVLETLKMDSLKDFDKKKDVEDILGASIPSEAFSQLLSLSNKITDYTGEAEANIDPDFDHKNTEIDDDIGVAVLFEDEDGEEDEDAENFDIREGSNDEEDDANPQEPDHDHEPDSDELSYRVHADNFGSRRSPDRERVFPHEVDGFWLQRLLSGSYPDPVTANSKTTAALSILSAESNLRECENQLMELFDYNKFDLVRILTKNRDVIVWCTKLSRSEEAERLNVEVAMREKGMGWILKELSGDRTKTAALPDAMDVDMQLSSTGRKVVLKSQTVAQALKTVDLEGMTFAQGGHLMSNKKVSLPEGSFKRSKKGYEEIHIPPPKPSSDNDERVSMEDMPAWVHPAFKGAKMLNRVQSKLYPMAFGTDEPLLLCAPTGAGKVSPK